jgi:hypothetical protein
VAKKNVNTIGKERNTLQMKDFIQAYLEDRDLALALAESIQTCNETKTILLDCKSGMRTGMPELIFF